MALIDEVVQFMVNLFGFDYEQQMVNAILQYFKDNIDEQDIIQNERIRSIATKSTKYVLLAIKQFAGIRLNQQEKQFTQKKDYTEIIDIMNKLFSTILQAEVSRQLAELFRGSIEPKLIETFQQVCARHLGFILAAFRHLINLDQANLILLANTYVTQIIEQKNWNNLLSIEQTDFMKTVKSIINAKLTKIINDQHDSSYLFMKI